MEYNDPQNRENSLSAQLNDLTVEETGERIRQSLLQQCNLLLNELEELELYLVKNKKDTRVELRHFKNSVKTELSLLQKVCTSNQFVLLPSGYRTSPSF